MIAGASINIFFIMIFILIIAVTTLIIIMVKRKNKKIRELNKLNETQLNMTYESVSGGSSNE